MTAGPIKNAFILPGITGPTGLFEIVNILATGPTGSGLTGRHKTYNQLTGPSGATGPTGTFKTFCYAGATGLVGKRTIIVPGFAAGGGGGAASTWNPADLLNVALTNLNKTATVTGGNAGVRSTTFKSAGKWYVEFNYSPGGTSNGMVGFADAAQLFSATTYFDAIGLDFQGNMVGRAFTPTWGVPTGHVIGCAIDLTARLYWWRYDAGAWNQGNGNASTDPATGIGGVNYNGTIAAGIPLALTLLGQNAAPQPSAIINVGPAFTNAAPAGFTAWG